MLRTVIHLVTRILVLLALLLAAVPARAHGNVSAALRSEQGGGYRADIEVKSFPTGIRVVIPFILSTRDV